ncbi:MAG: hypothetical protein MUO58_08910, partial [Anaerolineales bacterium]|nr:hypothetical protein [Anaerolineales bacterium]
CAQATDLVLKLPLYLFRDIHRNKRSHNTHVLPETYLPVKVTFMLTVPTTTERGFVMFPIRCGYTQFSV